MHRYPGKALWAERVGRRLRHTRAARSGMGEDAYSVTDLAVGPRGYHPTRQLRRSVQAAIVKRDGRGRVREAFKRVVDLNTPD